MDCTDSSIEAEQDFPRTLSMTTTVKELPWKESKKPLQYYKKILVGGAQVRNNARFVPWAAHSQTPWHVDARLLWGSAEVPPALGSRNPNTRLDV